MRFRYYCLEYTVAKMDLGEFLSEDEENYLDLMLTGKLSEETDDQDETFKPSNSQSIS